MKPRPILRNEAAPEGGDTGGGTAAPTQAAPPSAFNPDGSFAENWTSSLGDDFAPHAQSLNDFKDVKGLAKSYLHFRSTGPAYPSDQSQPEDISRFHALAKVPAEGTPTAYGLQIPEGIAPEEKAMYERIAAVAHKAHAPAPVVAAIVAEYQAIQGQVIAAENERIASEHKAYDDELIGQWGSKFEENKSIARHLISTMGASAGISADDPALASIINNPAFARIAVEFAKHTSEDRTRLPAGFGDIRSPQQRANSIMDGTDAVWGKKYTDGTDDERLAAYNEVVRLTKEAAV
jgi:hypothetical protein